MILTTSAAMKKVSSAKSKLLSEQRQRKPASAKMTLIKGGAAHGTKWSRSEENEAAMLSEPECLTKKQRLKLSQLMLKQLRNFLHDTKHGN
jgi:hypothetical protein